MLNNTNNISIIIEICPRNLFKNDNKIIIEADLKKLYFFKTEIIANECIIKFINDILEGPKNLTPLSDLISL